jgi:hypothetical protein
VRVALAALCESAHAREDGQIDVVGAAPDLVAVDRFPWRGSLPFALVLQLAPDEDLTQTGLNVSVVRAEDRTVVGSVDPSSARQARQVPTGVDVPVHLPFELALQVELPSPGQYAVLVRSPDGQILARVDVHAVTRG